MKKLPCEVWWKNYNIHEHNALVKVDIDLGIVQSILLILLLRPSLFSNIGIVHKLLVHWSDIFSIYIAIIIIKYRYCLIYI